MSRMSVISSVCASTMAWASSMVLGIAPPEAKAVVRSFHEERSKWSGAWVRQRPGRRHVCVAQPVTESGPTDGERCEGGREAN